MIQTASPVFGQLAALADPTRSRILLLLEQQPLSVTELCAVVQLPQSTVSRHLKVLGDEAWTAVRSEGASRLYRLGRLEPWARKLWQAVREEVRDTATGQQDAERLLAVLAERHNRSAAFFAAAAGKWEDVRRELFGHGSVTRPLLALLDRNWVVGDLGCGPGHLAATLAPFVGRVIGVDATPEMIEAARERLAGVSNVEIWHGSLEQLPVAAGELDVALLILVLHYVADPARVLAEAGRSLKSDGRLLIVDMVPHDRVEYRETMGHRWQGFSGEQLEQWLSSAGLVLDRRIELPPDPQAKGPNLFAAIARRS
ncbi:MAG: metalloregulator ArsR/SmtB family transcription factor [Gemmatimonadota bacterium]